MARNDASIPEQFWAFMRWQPTRNMAEQDKTPVTLLTGFLGAGKTTLLKHLLSTRQEQRFSLIINDVGEVNIDAEVLGQEYPPGNTTVEVLRELTQGCICCSINDELADAMVWLLEQNNPSHLFIEASGVANPRNILQSFCKVNPQGYSLLDAFRINNIVTCVDAALLAQEWRAMMRQNKRKRHVLLADPIKPYIELLIEQIEACDLIVLNKCDLVEPAEVDHLIAVLQQLNPRAEIIKTTEGVVAPHSVLDTPRFDFDYTQTGSATDRHLAKPFEIHEHDEESNGHGHEHSHEHHHPKHHHDHHGYGLETFVFKSRQPFKPRKLVQYLRNIPGLVRAKGYYWEADNPAFCGLVSVAGSLVRADIAGPWYIDFVERGEMNIEDMPNTIKRAWQDPPIGDRRQEIVFIGTNLDQASITAILDNLLDHDYNFTLQA